MLTATTARRASAAWATRMATATALTRHPHRCTVATLTRHVDAVLAATTTRSGATTTTRALAAPHAHRSFATTHGSNPRTYYDAVDASQWPAQWRARMDMWDAESAARRGVAAAANAPSSSSSSSPSSPAATVHVRLHVAGGGSPTTPFDCTVPLSTTVASLVSTYRQQQQPQQAQQAQTAPLLCDVNGTLFDLSRTLDSILADLRSSTSAALDITLLDHTDRRALDAFWHSSSHVLGQAIEWVYRDRDVYLSDGPALKDGGFFYDVGIYDRATGRLISVTPADFDAIIDTAQRIANERQRFERLEVSRDFALQLFAYNPFKTDILRALTVPTVTLYRCGPFIDLCRGPHVPHTGVLKSFTLTKTGRVHVHDARGHVDAHVEMIDRVYGHAFVSKAEFKLWKERRERAEKHDHRLLGQQQQLFMFHPLSPGSAFFLPHGTRVYNTLVGFLRKEYSRRGYLEVKTPLLFSHALWEQSGHWQNYKENMFLVSGGAETAADPLAAPTASPAPAPAASPAPPAPAASLLSIPSESCAAYSHTHPHAHPHAHAHTFALKPMNCPSHCLIFASTLHSYRSLPLRLADFSDLHRNEVSGALSGLTRVRRFAQDDAHIFCTPDQVMDELSQCLQFVQHVYDIFGFEFKLKLSTRPENYMGDLDVWERAEDALRAGLRAFGRPWEVNEGDGAFYGPKVDVIVLDALGREHQCATIQLDFQLHQRFDLTFVGAAPAAAPASANASAATPAPAPTRLRPVMIHRAILGSIERMFAILLEHYGGKWPLWLSPRQIALCTVSERNVAHALALQREWQERGWYVDAMTSEQSVAKKIREAQVAQYNYMLVVGDAEQANGTVAVRQRDHATPTTMPVDEFVARIQREIDTKVK